MPRLLLIAFISASAAVIIVCIVLMIPDADPVAEVLLQPGYAVAEGYWGADSPVVGILALAEKLAPLSLRQQLARVIGTHPSDLGYD
jgi:hypothetical protein